MQHQCLMLRICIATITRGEAPKPSQLMTLRALARVPTPSSRSKTLSSSLQHCVRTLQGLSTTRATSRVNFAFSVTPPLRLTSRPAMSTPLHTSPPDPASEGIRRRTLASSTPASDSTLSAHAAASDDPSSGSSSSHSPPLRPTFSRTPTDSASNSSSSSSSPRFDLPDDDPLFSNYSLLDLFNLIDAHVELFTRPLRRKSVTWREKADKLLDEAKARGKEFKVLPKFDFEGKKLMKLPEVPAFDLGLGTGAGDGTERRVLSQKDRERMERKYREVRQRTRESLGKLVVKWEEEKTVRLRDKISFLYGVLNVLLSSLLLGFHPTWIPAWYSIQMLFYTPYRVFTYKKKAYHYFLFDLCYAVNLLVLVYLWVLPSNAMLFEACYGLTLGTLGTAIATWRNSLVFHSLDKVISLAIHIFPPFVFTVIRHFYPREEALERYPALKELDHLRPWRTVAICMAVYTLWQLLYFHFVVQLRAEKIKEGRATSFTFMMNDKKRLIGKIAARVPERWREAAFMGGQAVYTFVTLLPPVFFLYDSKTLSSIYLLFLFVVSVWNGASFYLSVFGRRFEKELLALRKEYDAQQALLAKYAAIPSSCPHTPGVALQTDPLATSPETSTAEAVEMHRSAGGLEKIGEEKVGADGDQPQKIAEKDERPKSTVQKELGKVEQPGR